MKRICFSLISIILLITYSSVHAGGTQSIQGLQQQVLEHTTHHYREIFGKQHFANNIEIHVGNLDSRLRLAACDKKLTYKIQEPPRSLRNVTVKTSCKGSRRWTVYIPVSIDVYANVVVSNRSMEKGHIIDSQDLQYRRINTSSLGYGYIEEASRAQGMKLKRPLRAGDVIKLPHLSQPKVIHKGQTVTVRSNSRFLSVESAGIALTGGHIGQNIKVKNGQSNRVINAKIVAPGSVVVAAR